MLARFSCGTPGHLWKSADHRSEVVGRPLAALLANDGARVLSVDIDCKCGVLWIRNVS